MNMTVYVLFWYLSGVKVTWGRAHRARSWYLLGVTFKKSDEHPHHYCMGAPLPPGSIPLLPFSSPSLFWKPTSLPLSPFKCSSLVVVRGGLKDRWFAEIKVAEALLKMFLQECFPVCACKKQFVAETKYFPRHYS